MAPSILDTIVPSITDLKAKVGLQMPQGAVAHPLDPLSASEIAQSVSLARSAFPEGSSLWFKNVMLREPEKKALVAYLDAVHAGQASGLKPLDRIVEGLVALKDVKNTIAHEFVLNLSSNTVVSTTALPPSSNFHANVDVDEMIGAEEALFKIPEFQEAIKSLRLPKEAVVVADTWIYGSDTKKDVPRLLTFMVYYRLSSSLDSNHYALPLPIIPTVLASDYSLYSIEWTPIFSGDSLKTFQELSEKGFPWEKLVPNEYEHALRDAQGEVKTRTGLKPLIVQQPEGASFQINGRVITWQKWSMHIGFNFREGLGDVGAGICANSLDLGCDCLGEIHYFSWDNLNSRGDLTHAKNVVCVHEQDEGLGWKHTNFRTGNASVVRNRVLVVQTVITVANYEYIFAWKFDQAAAVHLETRATGILSTCSILPGEKSPFGNIVNPGTLATNHQHLFNIRIDPAIDGHDNTVVQEDSVAMPFDAANPPENNKWGVGYTIQKTPITEAGFADAKPEANRVFKIINPNKINPISGNPVGYKLVPAPSQLMLAHPDSVAYARAEFGSHHLWVTSYKEDELFSGGRYTNQSNGGAKGILSWVGRKDNVANTDCVVWHTFGLTHNPRVEDFPVMPVEIHTISLKPSDFFTVSPSIDVPASSQAFNKSSSYKPAPTDGTHMQGSAKVEIQAKEEGLNGSSCCSTKGQ